MSKLPKTLQTQVALSCYAIVSHHFAVFHNPAMRGPAFQWENFPEMMGSHCASGVFLNTGIPVRHAEAARRHARATGFRIATDLVAWMTGKQDEAEAGMSDKSEEAQVRQLGDQIGFGNLMTRASQIWRARDSHGAFSVGPCLALTVPCGCRAGCDWCEGAGWLTSKVKALKTAEAAQDER